MAIDLEPLRRALDAYAHDAAQPLRHSQECMTRQRKDRIHQFSDTAECVCPCHGLQKREELLSKVQAEFTKLEQEQRGDGCADPQACCFHTPSTASASVMICTVSPPEAPVAAGSYHRFLTFRKENIPSVIPCARHSMCFRRVRRWDMALTIERMAVAERLRDAERRVQRAVQDLDRRPEARTELARAKADAAAAEREAQALLARWRPD